MTEQTAMPNPVDLYQQAIARAKEVVAEVKQEQLDYTTPCAEWNVHSLINHLIGGAELAAAGLLGNPSTLTPGKAESSYISENSAGKLSQAYQIESDGVLDAAAKPGALERSLPTPFGDMPMAQFMMGTALDQLIHTWDLAKATGQDVSLSPSLVEAAYPVLTSGFADMGRQGGFVGPEVTVSDNASLQEKMIAYMGRQP